MFTKLNSSSETQTAIAFISASAGELDWLLPILDDLLKKGFNVKIIFLTRQARLSVTKNRMLDDYISQQNIQLEVYLLGGYFFEKIERLAYLSHRMSIKLKLNKKPIIKTVHNLLNTILKQFFLMSLPSEILNLKSKKCLFFSEYPSLRRPRDLWLKDDFENALFFYCPHSPHVYAEDLEKEYLDTQFKNFSNRYFLLLGHPADYFIINDGRELAASDIEKVFIGHPKYSNSWLYDLREKSNIFRSSLPIRNEINVLVLSRGSGSYLDDESHANLVEIAIKATLDQKANYNLFVKKHPREVNSHWDAIEDKYPSLTIIDDHIMNIATSVDYVISFWSSGAMDCYALGVPVIELFDPNKHSKQQVPVESGYTTISRLLGIALPANNLEELVIAISSLESNNYELPSSGPHLFYSDLMNRSNKWNTQIDKILLSHNLINS